MLKPNKTFHQCGWFKEHLLFFVLDPFHQMLAFDFSECDSFHFRILHKVPAQQLVS